MNDTSANIVMSHPHLNANVREAALAFAELGILDKFHTTIDTTFLSRLLKDSRVGRQLERRALPPQVHKRTHLHPQSEVSRLLLRKITGSDGRNFYGPDRAARAIDRAAARTVTQETTAVYAYEDSALMTFRAADRMGAKRIYDLPIGYWRAAESILGEEIELSPDWAGTLIGPQLANQRTRLSRKDDELALADHVIVASTFVRKTLSLADGLQANISVIPYGAPPPTDAFRPAPRVNKVVRALYVGALSQRKGISYMFDAIEQMEGRVTLTVVGLRVGGSAELDRHLSSSNVEYVPSLPHAQVLELMKSHDVLLFPSLFEGFGLVLTEALSQGLPVIATPNTAGPDLITDGIEGWIVPIRSSEAIVEKLETMYDQAEGRVSMGLAALARASTLRWDAYRYALSTLVLAIHND